MTTDNTELFTIHINLLSSQEVKCKDVTYRQFLFDGDIDGPLFTGRILPGGVDTQTIYDDGSGVLSARYMAEGQDAKGMSCKMYIDNVAKLGEETTTPKCYCDSDELSWLKDAELIGRMISDDEGFRIVIRRK